MENEKNNKGKNRVLILLIIIIVVLLTLVILFATGIIKYNSNTINDSSKNSITENDMVDINLSINNVEVSKDAPNTKISVTGTINLSYDTNKYKGITLSGYCLGTSGEKYLISGPNDGRVLFHNDGNNNLTFGENIPQKIVYSDGTSKSWDKIDWSNVKIKYCKIDKMTAVLNEGTNSPQFELNFEKTFNISNSTKDNLSANLIDNVKNLYLDQINKFFNENQYYDKSNVKFDLIYFNSDDVLDLVIMPNLNYGGVYGIYVYTNNKVSIIKDTKENEQFTSGPRGQAPCFYEKRGSMLWRLSNINNTTNNIDSENTFYVLNNNNILDTYSYISSTQNDVLVEEKYYYNYLETEKKQYDNIANKMKNLECKDFNNSNKMSYEEIMEKLK